MAEPEAQPEPETTTPSSDEDVEGVCCASARGQLDDAGITLALTDTKDGILAGPKGRLTTELRSLIRDKRDGLIRELLFREAVDYLQTHSASAREVETTEGGTAPAREDHARQREIDDERLGEAWHDGDLDEFKEALRSWLKSQVRLLHNSSHSRESGQDSDRDPEERSASEQPALM